MIKSVISLCVAALFGICLVCCGQQGGELKKPRVSVIASVDHGDEFIKGFLEDTVKQTIFPESELILVSTGFPNEEKAIVEEYTSKYPNIKYHEVGSDTGVYGVYNYGVDVALADYVTYANIADRRNPEFMEKQVEALEAEPGIDLVYAGYLMTFNPNETWENNHYRYVVNVPEFSPKIMNLCLPGPQPVWRKDMHSKYGEFDESFAYVGNWEFWCRAVSKGAKFAKLEGRSGLYYESGDAEQDKKAREQEGQRVIAEYQQFWR